MPETPLNDAAGAVHYKNPEEMLPEGFLERIQERGMLELDPGKLVAWRADCNMAYICGTTAKCIYDEGGGISSRVEVGL
ncbi:hypothetical protein Golax_007305 [Gossypium laxum]|uniref:Uncharacterized protein n=1 Tax=Gossypium laxum TaxID=34288 RepID=A0A7J9A6E9_9ROSI|nr:hypothetical protein [Gossypium laxum]